MTTEGGDAETEVNPGLEFFVWPKAYEHAAQTVLDKVFKEEALTNAYKAYTQLNDVQVTQVVKPTLRIDIRRRALISTIDNVSVTVRGLRRHQRGEEHFETRVSGSLVFSIGVVRAGPYSEPIYNAEVNSDNMAFSKSSRGSGGFDIFNSYSGICTSGAVNMFSSNCHINGSLKINSSNGNPMCFHNLHMTRNGENSSMSYSGRASDDDLGKTLVWAFSTALLESLNGHLPDYSFPIGSTSEWMFDFSGLAKPRFRHGYLGSAHVGAFHYSDIPATMQVQQASLFPEPQNSGRMLTMFVSNYLFNTIGYGFHGLSILRYNLTQDDLISTQDNMTRSIADCFPEFYVMYPGASVEVSIASTEAPTAKFSGQSLKVAMLGSAIFRAHLPNGSLENFLSSEVNLETTLLLKLNVNALTGTVTSILPTSITVVETVLHSLNREVLKEVFDLIATQFLWRKFEELASDGIPLPSPLLSGVEAFENVVVSTAADDYLRIDTDLRFAV